MENIFAMFLIFILMGFFGWCAGPSGRGLFTGKWELLDAIKCGIISGLTFVLYEVLSNIEDKGVTPLKILVVSISGIIIFILVLSIFMSFLGKKPIIAWILTIITVMAIVLYYYISSSHSYYG